MKRRPIVERRSLTGRTNPERVLLDEEARAEHFAAHPTSSPERAELWAAVLRHAEACGWPETRCRLAAWAHHNPSAGQGGGSARAAADALFQGVS